MVRCAVCQKEFESDKQLHAHIKAHKLRVAEYYQTHFARYDKYDNSIIAFFRMIRISSIPENPS